MDRRYDFRGVECVFEDYGRAQKRWKKNSQELSEDVAQRQQVEKPERMDKALVLEVFRDLGRDGGELPTTLAWVSTTPLGSAVVPEVKTISRGSEG